MTAAEEAADAALAKIENIVIEGVPAGGEDNFVTLRTHGEIPEFDFEPRDHLELGELLDAIDMERGTKVSGSRFYFLKGIGARLEIALMMLALDRALQAGFIPLIPPTLVRPEVMRGTGFLGQHSDEVYHLEEDDLYLVGTSEVPLAGYHMDEILDLSAGAKRYAGWSTCYRREAGSYGKDTRGIIRVHQFNKLEMFVYTTPEDAEAEHLRLVEMQEQMLQDLGLSYRVIDVAAGDLGSSAARKYDVEAWVPTQGAYRELTVDLELHDLPGASARHPPPPAASRAGRAARPSTSRRSTARSRRPAGSSRCSRRISARTARSSCRRCCARTSAGSRSWSRSRDGGPPARRPGSIKVVKPKKAAKLVERVARDTEDPTVATEHLLIVLDIDGTVLLEDESLSPGVVDAVEHAHRAGHEVMIATGRSWEGTRGILRALKHRARVRRLLERRRHPARSEADELRVRAVPHRDVRPRPRCSRCCASTCPTRSTWSSCPTVTASTPSISSDWNLANAPPRAVRRAQRAAGVPHRRRLARRHRAGLRRARRAHRPQPGLVRRRLDGLARHRPAGRRQEHRRSNRVREWLGIDPAHVLVIGDGRNDVGMFRWALENGGRAVAMEQGPQEVRDAAGEITTSVAGRRRRGGAPRGSDDLCASSAGLPATARLHRTCPGARWKNGPTVLSARLDACSTDAPARGIRREGCPSGRWTWS